MRVLYVLQGASETSIPLEIAARMDGGRVSVEVCSFDEPADETFGIEVHSLNGVNRLDPRFYFRLSTLISRIHPDIVHVHPNAIGSVVRLVLAHRDVRLVTTEHNAHDHFSRLKRIINGFTNGLNDVVVANSEATKESFAEWERRLLDVTGTEIRVIHNGVDMTALNGIDPCMASSSLPDGFLIGTAGRLVEQKDQASLLRAAKPLIEKHDDVHLILVGNGPLKPELEALADDIGIADQTVFLGYLPNRTDVHAVMTALDIFALPSVYEGFGVAVAEAMALGCPVVVTDIPVFREVVGDTGLYIHPSDRTAFSAVLERLYENPDERSALGEQAKRRIRDRYTLEQTVKKHETLYADLVEAE